MTTWTTSWSVLFQTRDMQNKGKRTK